MDEDLNSQAIAVAQRLALALDSQNWPVYGKTLLEVMGCPACEERLIGIVVTTLTLVLNQYEPGWQAETAEQLTDLIDTIHGCTVTDEAIYALLDEEGAV